MKVRAHQPDQDSHRTAHPAKSHGTTPRATLPKRSVQPSPASGTSPHGYKPLLTLNPASTELQTLEKIEVLKFFPLTDVKISTIVGILTSKRRINTVLSPVEQDKSSTA